MQKEYSRIFVLPAYLCIHLEIFIFPYLYTIYKLISIQVCVAGQMFSYGINFIRKSDILEIAPKATILSTQDYLSYFYYSGLW